MMPLMRVPVRFLASGFLASRFLASRLLASRFPAGPAIHLALALAALSLGLGAGPASAQRAPVERNLPPVVTGQGGLMLGPRDLGASTDDTPLGVELVGIRLIGPKEVAPTRPVRSIVIGDIGDIPRARLQGALTPFLGRPLTRKVVSDIQAAIAKVYRQAGYPFVSVTLPPQEVTQGTLVLRVAEFRLGAVKVQGAADEAEQLSLQGRLRAVPGERIAAQALDEDLDWLNRYPYRGVSGVFEPSDQIGLSTMNLEVTHTKPWQVFGGYSNTGTHDTGFDRYFAGFGAALPFLGDSFLSYQVTGSANFWKDPASVDDGADQPDYFSQAGRLVVPLGARQSIEFVPNYVATRQQGVIDAFAFTNTTFELPVLYRTAISNLVPGAYFGDLILGATAKRVSRTSYFDGTDIGGASANLFELIAGWAADSSDDYGRTAWDVRLIVNPSDVLGGNDDASWAVFSGGRVDDVSYGYGLFDLSRVTRLPANFAWVSQLSGTIAGQALPDTEQISLGGLYATRGYTLDDGNADTGIIWRNELRLPSFALLSNLGMKNVADELSPYAFADIGWGHNYGWESLLGPVDSFDVNMAGIGVGLDYRINTNVTASLALGYALTDAIYTQAGDVSLQGRIYIAY